MGLKITLNRLEGQSPLMEEAEEKVGDLGNGSLEWIQILRLAPSLKNLPLLLVKLETEWKELEGP